MRSFVLLAVVLSLVGCAQVREQFREHPVRTVVLVGGAIAVSAIATSRNDERRAEPFGPPICRDNPQACQ